MESTNAEFWNVAFSVIGGAILITLIGVLIFLLFGKKISGIYTYLFIPEKIEIKGEIIETFSLSKMTFFLASIDDTTLRADQNMWIPYELYYVKIWNPYTDMHENLEIDLNVYKEINERIKHLDLAIIIPCKKYLWSDEIEIIREI